MDSIKDIIPRVISPLSSGTASSSDIVAEWQRLSGGVQTSSVAAFKNGTLIIHVDCSARAVKMNLSKAGYIKELNKKSLAVKDIRFKVAKI
jgi:hypothetical protein